MTLFLLFPVPSYSIIQYNLIQLQKSPALDHTCTISITQQRRTTALFSFCITVQLQERPTLINTSYKYSYKYISPTTKWHNIQEHSALSQNWITAVTWHRFVHHSVASCWSQKINGPWSNWFKEPLKVRTVF